MTCRGSAATTQSRDAEVHITATPAYLPSEKSGGAHWFSYHIAIRNQGSAAVRLLSRVWRITDGNQRVREVRGAGVIGRQPRIAAGEVYQYTSYVDFVTPVGYMEGGYQFITDDGRAFTAAIGMFTLSVPGALH